MPRMLRWLRLRTMSAQQPIARDCAQAREGAAHGGNTEAEPPSCTGHTAFAEQRIKRGQEIEIDIGHASSHRWLACVR